MPQLKFPDRNFDPEFAREFGSGAGYAWPVADADSVAQSLCNYGQRASRAVGARAPEPTLIARVVEEMAADFPQLSFVSPDVNYDNYVKEVYELNWDSTPGYPLSQFGTTNRQLFQVVDGRPSEARLRMVYQFIEHRAHQLRLGPALDPIKVFVKQEPITLKKLQEGRQRLIFGVSVIDNLLAGIMFRPWFEKLLRWNELPFQFGCAIQMGGYRRIALRLQGSTVVAADKSSWDWTVTPWETAAFIALMSKWCFNFDALRCHALRSIFMAGRKLRVSASVEVQLRSSGVMPSGTFFTISANSVLQVLVHRVVCAELMVSYPDPLVCGDDTIQEDPQNDEYWNKWVEYGHIIKEKVVTQPGEPFEFMGHLFNAFECRPAYVEKHAFKLQHLPKDDTLNQEMISSFMHLYACYPAKSDLFRRRLVGTPYYVHGDQLQRWYHGWEAD